MFKIFKKKIAKEGLEKAKELGLISDKEFLKLKVLRADEDLKTFLNKSKKKRK